MFNIIDVKDNVITFTEKGSKRKIKRKLKPVASNVSNFKYKNKEYHLVEAYSKYGPEYKVFNYIKFDHDSKFRNYYWMWDDLEDALRLFVDKWDCILGRDPEEIPSAPDTSKFIEIKDGNINLKKYYYHRRASWLSPDYYPLLVTRGTAIKLDEIPQEFYDELFTLLLSGIECGLLIDNKTPRIGCIFGTAWIGWGLKNI